MGRQKEEKIGELEELLAQMLFLQAQEQQKQLVLFYLN